MIDISKLDKGAVLAALVNATGPMGLGALAAAHHPAPMTPTEGSEVLEENSRDGYVDYCMGRPIKCDFSGDELDPRLYDRDAGQGAAQRAIGVLLEAT